MRRITLVFGVLALVVFAAGIYGCGSSQKTDDSSSSQDDDQGKHSEHKDHGDHKDHGSKDTNGKSDMDKMKEELAKLSPDDAASAEKQHICPVSGKMLGTMGAPQKVDVKGQQVWICCAGCKSDLLKDPDEYLAKLKQD